MSCMNTAQRRRRHRPGQRRRRPARRPRRAAASGWPTTPWPRSPAAGRWSTALADDDQPHYGISTGFGALATTHIPPELRAQLQRSLIRSHAAGSGPEVEREVVRALMLLRLSTLATGRTGVRPETAAGATPRCSTPGITPVVHEYGSLGCSGDLAPLAHCALALMGEGEVRDAAGELRRRRRGAARAPASSRSSWPRRRAWR